MSTTGEKPMKFFATTVATKKPKNEGDTPQKVRIVLMFLKKSEHSKAVLSKVATRIGRENIKRYLGQLKPFGHEYWSATQEGLPEDFVKAYPSVHRVFKATKYSDHPTLSAVEKIYEKGGVVGGVSSDGV